MKIGVRLKIDVSKIDKAKLFNGSKGVYLDATAFIDLDNKDQYDNNGMITQDITKQEKEAGQQGAILGNTQVFWSDSQQAPAQQGYQNQQKPTYQQPQQQGGFQGQQMPSQQLAQKRAQQQAPKVNPQEPTIDFDDDIPFAPIGLQHRSILNCI